MLGGGLVRGSLVLLGGEPGIGKSTLLLQVADSLARSGKRVLYVCGEESPAQVKMRAEAARCDIGRVMLLPGTDVTAVGSRGAPAKPGVLVVDSIQTVFDPELSGAAGSVGQVRASTARLLRVAKEHGVTTLLVGHVTKDGAIAGPRVLEHMVDTVLYFEGDRDHAFRIVRAVKNRFGSISEIGVFEMAEGGLRRRGFALFRAACRAGPRRLPAPRSWPPWKARGRCSSRYRRSSAPRTCRCPVAWPPGLTPLGSCKSSPCSSAGRGCPSPARTSMCPWSAASGIAEPAVDLPLALALASALRDVPLPFDVAAFGELGLTGQVRPVSQAGARIRESINLGMGRVFELRHGRLTLPTWSGSTAFQPPRRPCACSCKAELPRRLGRANGRAEFHRG